MIRKVPFNFNKQNEYSFYHICFFDENKIIEKSFDLTFEEAVCMINKQNKNYDFIVIGTINNINNCLDYVNNGKNTSIIGCDIDKNDIFENEDGIFVNCTEFFKTV